MPRRPTPRHQELIDGEQQQWRDPGRRQVQVRGRVRDDVRREGVHRATDDRAEAVTSPVADRQPGGKSAEGDAHNQNDVESEDWAADLRRKPAENPQERHRRAPHQIHPGGRTDLSREERIETIRDRMGGPAEVPDCLFLVAAAAGPTGCRVLPGPKGEDQGPAKVAEHHRECAAAPAGPPVKPAERQARSRVFDLDRPRWHPSSFGGNATCLTRSWYPSPSSARSAAFRAR